MARGTKTHSGGIGSGMHRKVERDEANEEDPCEDAERHDGALSEQLLSEIEADEPKEDEDHSHQRHEEHSWLRSTGIVVLPVVGRWSVDRVGSLTCGSFLRIGTLILLLGLRRHDEAVDNAVIEYAGFLQSSTFVVHDASIENQSHHLILAQLPAEVASFESANFLVLASLHFQLRVVEKSDAEFDNLTLGRWGVHLFLRRSAIQYVVF